MAPCRGLMGVWFLFLLLLLLLLLLLPGSFLGEPVAGRAGGLESGQGQLHCRYPPQDCGDCPEAPLDKDQRLRLRLGLGLLMYELG